MVLVGTYIKTYTVPSLLIPDSALAQNKADVMLHGHWAHRTEQPAVQQPAAPGPKYGLGSTNNSPGGPTRMGTRITM